ncbi:MAG: sugar transferase [Desulfosudis oleivorans]|nr:sugar transferase [Desulfosudis oleivorans]
MRRLRARPGLPLRLSSSTTSSTMPLPPLLKFWLALAFAVPYWCLALYANGMYQSMRTRTYLEILWAVIKSAVVTFLLLGTVIFLFKLTFMSRLFFMLFMGFGFVFIWLEKTAIFMSSHYVRRQGLNTRRLLDRGDGQAGRRVRQEGRQASRVGLRDPRGHRRRARPRHHTGSGAWRSSATLEDIPRIFHRDAVDEVVFVVPRSRLNSLQGAIDDCETEGRRGDRRRRPLRHEAGQVLGRRARRHAPAPLQDDPRQGVGAPHQASVRFRGLRDLGILVLSPLFLVMAILIKATSKGPVFFKQNRLGLAGRRFTLYKFRTMRQGAHDVLSDVPDLESMTTPEFREKKTSWITPVGRFMRKFSIDELPQLFNVFVGHMSIVGPRPTVPDEVEKYKDWQRRRFSMKPGITCLWQVNGRNNIAFEDWMKLDLEYLDNWSLWLDAKILMKTVPVVLFGIGAY